MIIPQKVNGKQRQGAAAEAGVSSAAATTAVSVGVGAAKEVQPPSGNTGAGNTRTLIDNVACTFHGRILEVVQGLFGAGLEWRKAERGALGYLTCWQRGNVKIYCDGSLGMGIHVEVSGQGCRQLEAEGMIDNDCPELGYVGGWRGKIADILYLGGKFTRLDTAIDEKAGLLDVGVIEAAVRSGSVVARFRKSNMTEGVDLSTGSSGGKTVYLGSGKSNMFVRIYNKAEQMQLPAGEKWVRVEIQARNERANQLAAAIVERDMGAVAAVLANYVDIKQPAADSNRSRWETVGYWSEFLGGIAKLKIAVAPERKTVVEMAVWIERQVAPALATVVSLPAYGRRWLAEMLDVGASRWRTKHIEAMGQALADVPVNDTTAFVLSRVCAKGALSLPMAGVRSRQVLAFV